MQQTPVGDTNKTSQSFLMCLSSVECFCRKERKLNSYEEKEKLWSDIARNIPNNEGFKKNKSCIVPFYCRMKWVFCWPIIFHCFGFLHHWAHAKGCGRGGVVLFSGQNKPLHRQRETKCDWMGFERVMQNTELVRVPSLPSCCSEVLIPQGNVDPLPPASSVWGTLPCFWEDILKVLTLLSWQGSSPVAEVHAGSLTEVCSIFDSITVNTLVWFCFAWAS